MVKRLCEIRHRFKQSLQARLLSSACLLMFLILFSSAIFLPTAAERYLFSELKEQANLYLDELTAFVEVGPEDKPVLLMPLSDPRFRKPYSGWYWQIDSKGGQLRSRSMWDSQRPLEQFFNKNSDDLLYIHRLIYVSGTDKPVQVAVGINTDSVDGTLDFLTWGILLALAAISFSMLMLLWWQVQWSLKPLQHLRKDLSHVREGQSDGLKNQYPTEVQPVVDDLNALLFHYSELLERARSHTGNLAHAIKTPLSIIQNQIDWLPEQHQVILRPAINDLLGRMNYHLGRARLAGSSKILSVQSCPADVVDSVAQAFEKLYINRGVVLVNELDDEIKLNVENLDLEEMLGNLIENAFKWSGGFIRVHGDTEGDRLLLSIEDNGPGLPETQRKEVLKRGVRLDEQTPGSGLGLSIVQDIAGSYQGAVSLEDSSLRGLKVTLKLPLASITRKKQN